MARQPKQPSSAKNFKVSEDVSADFSILMKRQNLNFTQVIGKFMEACIKNGRIPMEFLESASLEYELEQQMIRGEQAKILLERLK